MFFDDAVLASKVLNITLTSRDKNSKNPVPLCGVPHHSAQGYITRLIEDGHKVAICEQVENPKEAKGIVKREVVRVLTPGLQTDTEGLPSNETNALVSLVPSDKSVALAWMDVGTGNFRVTRFDEFQKAEEEVHRLAPKEILLPDGALPRHVEPWMMAFQTMNPRVRFERLPTWAFENEEKKLKERFRVGSLDGFGLERSQEMTKACASLLFYVESMNRMDLPHLYPPKPYVVNDFLHMDSATRGHLELFSSFGKPGKEQTLFGVLNETATSMGARCLRDWIHFPLRQKDEIENRLQAVEELFDGGEMRESCRSDLAHVYDMERLIGRIAGKRANARDLVAFRSTLERIIPIKAQLEKAKSKNLILLSNRLNPHEELIELLRNGVVDDPPVSTKEGGMIRDGFREKLDELRKLTRGGRQWIAKLEKEEKNTKWHSESQSWIQSRLRLLPRG